MPGPKRTKKRGSGCRFRPEIQGAAVDGVVGKPQDLRGFYTYQVVQDLDCHQRKVPSRQLGFVKAESAIKFINHLVRKCVELFPTSEVLHIINDSESIYPVQCREADPIERETIVLRGDLLC